MAEPLPEAITRFAEQYRIPPGYVLQVGRIEPGKNQYHVIEALMEDKEIPLVFVGNQRANSKYFRTTEVHAHKRGNVFFFDEVAQSELTLFYRNARLHILPSLGETTGLVSLEALACGCPIVVANERYCPFNSYFNGLATAVDPLCPEAIRAGIFSEFAVKRDMQTISRRIRLQYSWLLAARQTYEAYQCVVGHAEKLSSDKAEKVVAQHTKNGKSHYAI
jgi:glycosyltransferase involved in cell wall biosynthesis